MDETKIKAIIEQGTHHRGWISNSYAQIEYLLGDLIMRCRVFPEYAEYTKTVSHSAMTRVGRVRSILALDGPMKQFAGEFIALLDAFEGNHEIRNPLAHGFCEFHHTPEGDAGFIFRKFDRVAAAEADDEGAYIIRTFRLIDLQYHREQLIDQSSQAIQLFHDIHTAFGWAGTPATTREHDPSKV
ncbi:hypothetical protein [Sphingobium nicotianae]|uniref:Uncharacterized protein n=1 Tax=Sphingobium nicotianae TaxID=2782607 RepID=A0A9X1IRH7_9SPHN|nr:hypothetical protein [Sphingobium nicotianae]MBT2187215.1 hypothetical protein [Sphingobium nicotianae]